IDSKQDAGGVARLHHALRQHQDVPIRIGVDCSWTQRFLFESNRIVVAVVIACLRPPVSGLDAIRNGRSHEISETLHKPSRPRRSPRYPEDRWLGKNSK